MRETYKDKLEEKVERGVVSHVAIGYPQIEATVLSSLPPCTHMRTCARTHTHPSSPIPQCPQLKSKESRVWFLPAHSQRLLLPKIGR